MIPAARRVATWWVRNRDVRIATGVGAGLRFRVGDANPSYAFGTNELPVQHALATYLKPGHVFCDIGANVGFFTVIAARLVGPSGRVYAFEPMPDNAVLLRRNVELNAFRHVTVVEKAVSSASGQGELLLSHFSGGSALLTATAPPDLKGRIPVELVSVDDLVAGRDVAAPNVVKIDVEGAELDVLRGMSATIQAHKPIIVYEVDDGDPEAFERKQADCRSFLQPFGYRLSVLENSYPYGDWRVANITAVPEDAGASA
jgi:FkbM family methyltransferase